MHALRAGHALLALIAVTSIACGTPPAVRITSEANPTARFSTYRTYNWATPPPERPGPSNKREILEWRIGNAVEAQLAAKGFVKALSGRPDFLIDYHIERRQKNTETIGDYIRYRQSGGDADVAEAYVFGYEEGSLVLDVFDGQTRDLVWRASATGVINPDQQQARVTEAVRQMLQRFPSP
jgi:hypothetical protein